MITYQTHRLNMQMDSTCRLSVRLLILMGFTYVITMIILSCERELSFLLASIFEHKCLKLYL